MDSYGIISLVPVVVVIVTAIISKRALESLLLGTFVATIIIAQGDWFNLWMDVTFTEFGDSAYYILMFGLFGALIKILEFSGAAMGFSDIGAKIANTRKKTLILTWILGLIIFVEDYLNALGVGIAMQKLTDRFKVSRQYLAFIVNSTGAAVCILVPFSSWGVLYAAQIESVGVITDMSGFAAYARAIPYMLYAWAAVVVVPLFCLGIIPLFGPMKKAEERALLYGEVFPEDYYKEGEESEELIASTKEIKTSSALNFIIPMLILIGVTIYTEDILLGVIFALITCFVLLFPQKLITLGKFCDYTVEGFKDMLYVTGLVLVAFVLQNFNDMLGLTPYVIESVTPILSPALFPAVVFLVVGAIAFSTGSFWGVAAISFPIILPLAVALEVNIFMAIGVVAAATAFGSHTCFYSDAVTVTCASTGIKNMDYSKTALPLISIPFVIGMIGYLIMGFIMA
ncbi:Na+/H+ antiporter NhaC family protein [Natronincola ferrireducens]|uniref:Transporter, NhaC family n=1 Tax=Natronincola ferrireducens TaxID=393762 RepID=A0A1G8ZEE0_9FIRM|nr:Na+/H+ antiporter NhaC family protein [Natronincola ferrireducens]SDK12765.1 transporter, NhaC family [Natronincola ferrireducens]